MISGSIGTRCGPLIAINPQEVKESRLGWSILHPGSTGSRCLQPPEPTEPTAAARAILTFDPDGTITGSFSSHPRIANPCGLSLDRSGALVSLNSGDGRILAPDPHGNVVRGSG
jgi:hypothetical protein